MEGNNYPFPLAADSSHHSHYHRFLLGAPAQVLAPLPKPYCVGRLMVPLEGLAKDLNLQRWRKLYQASFPWVDGFGPPHYLPENTPANRALPAHYQRPARRFGAYDFVQIADPSVSALALVAGDRRVLVGYVGLCDGFFRAIEPEARPWEADPEGRRTTGRLLAGQFAEPNNRWLMPLLHVHCRVLNLTSFESTPRRLACIDPGPLGRAARSEMRRWTALQAGLLRELGYAAEVREGVRPFLRVQGVTDSLLATMEAPRLAVLKLLERILVGDRPRPSGFLGRELPAQVVAVLVEELETLVARSLSYVKPPKVGVPSEGPWRLAVRSHIGSRCPAGLLQIDEAASRARFEPLGTSILPSPSRDAAHRHSPEISCLEAPEQMPLDPDLGAEKSQLAPEAAPGPWLALEFERNLADIHARTGRGAETLLPLRAQLRGLDQICDGATVEQLRQARSLLDVELERVSARRPEAAWPGPGYRGARPEPAAFLRTGPAAGDRGLAHHAGAGGRSL